MTRGVRFFLILGVGLLAIDGAVFGLMMRRAPEAHPPQGNIVSSGTAAIGGPFALVTADGKSVTDQTYRGKWMVIYFGYTACPDACPTALTNMSIALQKLRGEAGPIRPLFITVDPTRDTAAVLRDYLTSFDPRIVGLTGSEAQTEAVAKAYRVYVKSQKSEGADYPVDHSSYMYLMDLTGKFVDVIEGDDISRSTGRLVAEVDTGTLGVQGKRYMSYLIAALMVVLGSSAAAGAELPAAGGVAVEHSWARASPKGAPNGVAYVTIVNKGAEADRLVGASSPVAENIQFHEERTEAGISKMRQLDAIDVPPGATVTLKPSSVHLMLRLAQPLKEGETFPLTLTFAKAGAVVVTVKVRKVGAMHDMSGM
jgi:protein SCO1/2